MKNTEMFNAVSDIRDDIVAKAENYTFTKKGTGRSWRVAAVAACLAVSIILGIVFWPGGEPVYLNDVYLGAYAITSAEYPETVKFPIRSDFSTDEEYKEAYRLWREHRKNTDKEHPVDFTTIKDFTESTAVQFLTETDNENPIYSPMSLYMALAMTAEATNGESRQQILDLLGEEDITHLRAKANSVWNRLYKDDGANKTILATSLWLNEKISYNKETLETLSRNYYSDTFKGDMSSPDYTSAFQYWLNQKTAGLLQEQIAELDFHPEALLAIASTLYFEAKWDVEFKEEDTKEATFHAPKKDITCEFMNRVSSEYYFWGEKFSAAQKSFEDGEKMLFILPDEDYFVDDLLADSEVMNLIAHHNDPEFENRSYALVDLSVPKFDVTSKTDLIDGLKELGITDIFGSDADFSPIFSEPAAVSKAEQASRVTIDEQGCKAASYTVMMMFGAMAPVDKINFVLDRPFIFVISTSDGAPLFIGVVNNPQ